MMWLSITIFSYLLFALVALADKFLLKSQMPNPKVYAFFVGILSGVGFILIPFGFMEVPALLIILFALLAGFSRIIALWLLYAGLKRFEASKVVPAIGGLEPILIFFFVFLLLREIPFPGADILAFVLLVAGTIGISMEEKASLTAQSLKISFFSALFFSLSFVFAKLAYKANPGDFVSNFLWLLLGSFLGSFFFLLFKETREGISQMMKNTKEQVSSQKTTIFFVSNQAMGGAAAILQQYATSLVPLALLPFIAALGGLQYFFIFVFALFLSLVAPNVLKEKISFRNVAQKVVSIGLISGGLALLFF